MMRRLLLILLLFPLLATAQQIGLGVQLPSQAMAKPPATAVSYCAEAEALFARMLVAPNAARKTLINTTIESLKSAGIWELIEVIYFTAAHDSSAVYLNWVGVDATTDLVPVDYNGVFPTIVADSGIYGDETCAESNCPDAFLPAPYDFALASVNDVTMAVYISDTGTTHTRVGTMNFEFNFITNRALLNSTVPISFTDDTGLMAVTRPASTTLTYYHNGDSTQTITNATAFPATFNNPYLLSYDGGFDRSDHVVSFYFVGGALTVAQHESLYTIVQNYLSNVFTP